MSWQTAASACVESLRYPNSRWSMPKEKALAILRQMSNENFGDDADKWEQWAKANDQWDFLPHNNRPLDPRWE